MLLWKGCILPSDDPHDRQEEGPAFFHQRSVEYLDEFGFTHDSFLFNVRSMWLVLEAHKFRENLSVWNPKYYTNTRSR